MRPERGAPDWLRGLRDGVHAGTGFNEAGARRSGLADGQARPAASGPDASMRPERGAPDWRSGRGSRSGPRTAASMRPERGAPDWSAAMLGGSRLWPRFNEAGARRSGLGLRHPLGRGAPDCLFRSYDASMRPERGAPDWASSAARLRARPIASMRPERGAPDWLAEVAALERKLDASMRPERGAPDWDRRAGGGDGRMNYASMRPERGAPDWDPF